MNKSARFDTKVVEPVLQVERLAEPPSVALVVELEPESLLVPRAAFCEHV